MDRDLMGVEIKIEIVEDRLKGIDDKWFRIKGKDIKTNESCFYSWWDSKSTPIIGKTYAIRYTLSKPDAKGKQYRNIKDAVEIEIGKDGYIEVKETVDTGTEEPEKVTTTSAPVQKSYSKMINADQTETLLNILIVEVKEIKEQVEDISSYIYNKNEKNKDKKNKEEK